MVAIEQEFKPKYFPLIYETSKPSISEDAIDLIAFVLAGVDPNERHNVSLGHMDLSRLATDPTVKRVGSSSGLREDHMYILSPRFDFASVDFEEIWQDSKRVPSGQESTDLLKLVKQIHRIEMDDDGAELRAAKNAELIKDVREQSHRLLFRLHRNAVRHIDEIIKGPLKTSTQPWYVSVLNRVGLRKRDVIEKVQVNEEIRKEASRYVWDAINIARILRVPERRI